MQTTRFVYLTHCSEADRRLFAAACLTAVCSRRPQHLMVLDLPSLQLPRGDPITLTDRDVELKFEGL